MKTGYVLTAAAAAFLVATGAHAAGAKIVGGAEEITAGGVVFSMTVNAIETKAGLKGSVQYSREANGGADALSVHASVGCSWISPDGQRAVVAGPASLQVGVMEGEWFFAAIREGGVGYGDEVRAGFASEAQAQAKCENGETLFPGLVLEGNFTINPGA